MTLATDIARLYGRLISLFAIGHVHVVDDSGDQQMMQARILGGGPDEEVIDGLPRLGDYGIAYCPPDGSEALFLFLGGRRSSGVVFGTGHKASRPKGLLPGEVQIYNGLTGAFVKFCQDGKIRSQGDWLHDGAFSATGDIKDHSADGKGQTMEASRQTFNGHTHPAGTPNTGVPNQQEPS